MANRFFSAYFGVPANFEQPTPAWDKWALLFADVTAGGVATMTATCVQNTLSPLVVALVYTDDLDPIHFVHSPTVQLVLLVDNDAAMPEIHQALARNKESSHEAIILEGALLRVQADSVLPVTDGNRVKVTRHLVDIFRRHNIYAEESVLGEGLSPFSMVCQGHPNAADSKRLLDDSALVERGASLTLQDARAMAGSDARIPQFLQHVTDKLYAHSHCWNLYAGNRHILATAIAIATLALGPVIMNLANYFGSPALALRMALRILFKFQQLTFRWVRRRRDTPRGTVVPVPDYMDMVYDVQSFLFHGMPELPVAWNNLIRDENNRGQERQPERIRGGAGSGGTGAEAQATVYNTTQDQGLKDRWVSSGLEKTSQLTQNYTGAGTASAAIPKFRGNQSACLNWACKGQCSNHCPLAAAHQGIGAALVWEMHVFLDQCGVARS